ECLEELATGSLRELSPESAVSRHAAACPDCGPLLTQLRDREYQAATILNTLPPISDPIIVAETAGKLSHRRRMGSVVVTFASIALGLSIWFAASTLIPDIIDGGHGMGGLQTETIPLSCLSPQQAGEIINPYVRGRDRIYYTTAGVSAITVRASPPEIWKIKDVLKTFDNSLTSTCQTGVKATVDELRRQLEGGATLNQVQKTLEEQIRATPSADAPALAGEKPQPGNRTKPRR
ncbi:MAG TPA: hypothetical protein VJ865_13715, partial [Gemmatimonadaceae bacterium]|nr:hypothetical protein [Gemmatimonadaceae bacterium]